MHLWAIYEPCHDKTNIVRLRPAWIQTSLRICAVWSGSMLFAISFSTFSRVDKQTAWILIRLRECADWSGSMLVAYALCWFCHDMAQIYFCTCINCIILQCYYFWSCISAEILNLYIVLFVFHQLQMKLWIRVHLFRKNDLLKDTLR
jgi:hypothetical protein